MNQTETISIPVTRYRDSGGQPTCAINFQTGKVCKFYRTQRMGGHETCVFALDHGRLQEMLHRRDNSQGAGMGSLIPLKTCPVWKDAA